MINTLKKYFINTIKHYCSLDDEVLFSDIQLSPFLFLRESTNNDLENIAEYYFSDYPCVSNPLFLTAGYLQDSNDWKQCNLLHPFNFAYLESLGWLIFDNYQSQRNSEVEVYFAGAPNNTLFGQQYDFAKYTESVVAHKCKYSHYITADVASFSKSVDIAKLINKVREGCKSNVIFNEDFYLTLYSVFTNFGDGFLPQFKTHSACRFLSSVVAFDSADCKFFDALQNKKGVKDFKLIRNGDEILVLFNPQNTELVDECKNSILQIYTSILQEEGLKANSEKSHFGVTTELGQAVYSDSLITKVAMKGNDAISGTHKAPKVAMISFLRRMSTSGLWSRRWTNIALRLLVIDNADKFTNNKQREFLEKIINQKHKEALYFINEFCTNKSAVSFYEKNNTEPLVTLVVRTYNSEQTLKKCLQSVCFQANENFEIFIADDGSTDQSVTIAKSFERGYKNIHLLPMAHCGKVKAREIAVKFARGKYITFCDGDDFVDKNFCDSVTKALIKENPQLIVYGYNNCYSNSSEVFLPNCELCNLSQSDEQEIKKFTLSNFELGSCMCVFERNLLLNSLHNNYEMNMFEDFAFTYPCLLQAENICFINKVLYHYNKTNKSSSTNICNAKFNDLLTCAEYYLTLIKENKIEEVYYSTLLNLILNWIAIELKRLFEYDENSLNEIDVKKLCAILDNFSDLTKLDTIATRNKKLFQILKSGKLTRAVRFLDFDSNIYKLINNFNINKDDNVSSVLPQISNTTKQNLISIIIPALNCENTIANTLHTLINQDTNTDYEIIVVDNNSTDNTLKIAKEILQYYPLCQIHTIKEHNVNIARKLGMQKSKGDYVLFVDADDALSKKAIAHLSATINHHPNIEIIAFDYIRHQDDWTKIYANYYKQGFYNFSEIQASVCQNIIHNFNDTLWSYCYKKSFIQKFYTSDDSIKRGEDTASIFNCLAHANSLYNLHKPLYAYNCTNNFASITQAELDKVIDVIINNCLHIDNLDYQLKQLKNLFQVS